MTTRASGDGPEILPGTEQGNHCVMVGWTDAVVRDIDVAGEMGRGDRAKPHRPGGLAERCLQQFARHPDTPRAATLVRSIRLRF